jgi:hypothetical protein
MATRAVLVGLAGNSKLYYLLDNRQDGKDAALIDSPDDIRYINFFDFIRRTPNIVELHSTELHHFIWSPRGDDQKDRWKRIFVNKTQKVTRDMLSGVDVVPDIAPKRKREQVKKKNDLNNRALNFKHMMASGNPEVLNPLYDARRIDYRMRSSIGFKAIGNPISVQRGYDGDGDGFVDDGLPTMRPFIVGFDISGIPSTQSSRSVVTAPRDLASDRKIDYGSAKARLEEVNDTAALRYNSGVPIRTKADAIRALSNGIKSFSTPIDGKKSTIDFLESLSDDDQLKPWQISYVSQFLLMIGSHPNKDDVLYEIKSFGRKRKAGVDGETAGLPSTKDWEISSEFGIPLPGKVYPTGKIEVKYLDPSTEDGMATLVAHAIGTDTKNIAFNIMSPTVDVGFMADLQSTGIAPNVLAFFAEAQNMKRIISERAQSVLFPSGSLSVDVYAGAAQMLANINNFIATTAPDGRSIRPEILRDLQNSIMSGNIDVPLFARAVRQLQGNLDRSLMSTEYGDAQAKIASLVPKWGEVAATSTGVHESVHVMHLLSNNARTLRRASVHRDEFLAEHVKTLQQQTGKQLTKQEIADIKQRLPEVAFIYSVLFDDLEKLSKSNPDEFRFKVLQWGLEASGISSYSLDPNGAFGSFQNLSSSMLGMYKGALENRNELLALMSRPEWNRISQFQRDALQQQLLNLDNIIQIHEDFFDSPIIIGQKVATVSDEVARVINEINDATSQGTNVNKVFPGDPLTIGHLSLMMHMSVLGAEDSTNKTFRGLNLTNPERQRNIILALHSLGYPDLKFGSRKVKGFDAKNAQTIVDSLAAITPMFMDIIEGIRAGDDILDLLTSARQRPGSILLPPQFGQVNYDDFFAMPVDEIFARLVESFGVSVAFSMLMDQSSSTNNTAHLLDTFRYTLGQYGNMSPNDIMELLKLSGKVGLPTGRSNAPAYSNYQSYLLAGQHVFYPEAFSLMEFAAETAVAELFQMPISQVNDTGIDTRRLDNNELMIIAKFLNYIFPNGLPYDMLSDGI